MGGGGTERRHIIGIENLSTASIPHLRAVAESFEPYLQGATWVDAPLHPLRSPTDNEGRFDLSRGDGSPTRYIEILQELRVGNGGPPILTFVYDQSSLNALQRFMVGNWFAITVRIQGDIKPEIIRLVAKLNAATNRFDVAESNERMPTVNPSNYSVVALTQGAPAPEPLPSAMPSHAYEPDDDGD